MIRVIGPKEKTDTSDGVVVNTTSRSKTWSAGLSPFFLGPVALYGDHVSQNVENAWQYAKLYKCHADENGSPTIEYWKWAATGWKKARADRYPMGKGAIPECSIWRYKKLGYIEARKKIYIPLYSQVVRRSAAYKRLVEFYKGLDKPLYLWDFDGYDHIDMGMSFDDVLHQASRPMGHAFVIAKMLTME